MNPTRWKLFTVAGLGLVCLAAALSLHTTKQNGARRPAHSEGEIGDFTLLDHTGEIHSLYRYAGKKAVVIIGQQNGAPELRDWAERLNGLGVKRKDLALLLLNANPADERRAIMQEAQALSLKVPILMDPSQIVSRSLGLKRSGEAVILNPEGWRVVARGAADGQLFAALENQNGQEKPLLNPAAGRLFPLREFHDISYERDIVPLVQAKCMGCHNRRGRYPPVLDTYEKLRGWSAMIRETILTERMPPFSADPLYGPYLNDVSLSADEKATFVAWVDAGMPRKGSGEPLASWRPRNPRARALLGKKPIYSVSMPKAAPIPPGGTLEYQYFQLGGAVPEDMWVEAINVISTNPRQLHHESLMVVSKPLSFYEEIARRKRDERYVARNKDGDIPIYTLAAAMTYEIGRGDPNFTRQQVWAAGRPQPFLIGKNREDRVALFVPKGYYLMLETHYMGTGKPDSERTTIELYGAKAREGRYQIRSLLLATTRIQIPAGASRYVVNTPEYPIKKNIKIYNVLGHLHMRGRSIKMVKHEPDREPEVFLSIPNFYYGWQTGMGLAPAKPVAIKAGTKLSALCEYDNSPLNPNNPDPAKQVNFGQTVDRTEMCHFNLNYAEVD